MGSSASSWVLLKKRHEMDSNWFKCLLWLCFCPWIIYTISPILLRIVPSSQYGIFFLKIFEKIFWPRRNRFLVTCSVVFILDCFGINLSNADLIFLANMISASEPVEGVFGFGVIRYTCRNCCKALSVGVPCAFLSALFSVSTNLTIRSWVGYCGVITCFTWNVLQKSLNSADVNCVPLSLTTQSHTPNLANSSCRKSLVTAVVGLLHLKTSDHNKIVVIL